MRPHFTLRHSRTVAVGLTLTPGPHLINNQIKVLDPDMLHSEINLITRMQRKGECGGKVRYSPPKCRMS